MAPRPSISGPDGAGSKKRKVGVQAGSARSDVFVQKRANVHAARSIPAQHGDAALKDGELDLEAFVAAHEFEIRSLEQSMATSKAVGSTRAFQQVPRGLRRRTASHNHKRVPRRLRARARKEMAEDNTPLVEARRRKPRTTRARLRAETAKKLGILAARKRKRKLEQTKSKGSDAVNLETENVVGRKPRPKIRRNQVNEPPKPTAKFRRRQLNKTWLPTHLWHAKRARMTQPSDPLWGFAIPLTPNEKIHRPTYRAQGRKGVVVWDMSYMSTIGLYGNIAGISRSLIRLGIVEKACWDQRGRDWRSGARAWSGTLARSTGGISRRIGPCTVLWNPEQKQELVELRPSKVQRQVFLRIHPSTFLEVFNELLKLIKLETPHLHIEDLRFEIGSIELSGPASTETLLSVLTPHPATGASKPGHGELFKSLIGLTNPAALPNNAALQFNIQDPRLRYPPRKQVSPESDESEAKLMEILATWPVVGGLQPSGLYDRNARHTASSLPTQKSINRRRSTITPGSFLKPGIVDPLIPIILTAHRPKADLQVQGTWTLMLPWKCVLPVWYSIVHCPLISGGNPRFGGLNESMQVAFERASPWFPANFIGTDAGAEWELKQRAIRRRDWEKRPKSKRVEWKSLDLGAGRKGEIGDGLACDFELLFGLTRKSEAQEDHGVAEATDASSSKPEEPQPLKLINHISKAVLGMRLNVPSSSPLPPNAVFNVRLVFVSRGVVKPCARIYSLPAETDTAVAASDAEVPATLPPQRESKSSLPKNLRSQWLTRTPDTQRNRIPRFRRENKSIAIGQRERLVAQQLISRPALEPPPLPNEESIGGIHPLVPNPDQLIGFVTTGSFSLAEGRGAAIGTLLAEKFSESLRKRVVSEKICIVRNAGENVGWLARWDFLSWFE